MVAKAGLGLIGISAISVGGVALTKPHLLGMDYMPQWHSLSEDSGFPGETSGYKGKYGEKYGKYLVGVTNKGNGDGDKHESWWEWAYRRLSKDGLSSGVFATEGNKAKVKRGYGDNGGLNKVCETAYKKSEVDLKGDNNREAITDTDFKKSDVWKYCSVGQKQPQTISEFNTNNNTGQETYSNGIGKEGDEKNKLLSINSKNNEWVWDLKDKEFEFANVTEKYFQAKKKGPNRKTIRKICEEAYASEATTSDEQDKPTKNGTVKYCSLEGK